MKKLGPLNLFQIPKSLERHSIPETIHDHIDKKAGEVGGAGVGWGGGGGFRGRRLELRSSSRLAVRAAHSRWRRARCVARADAAG